MTAATGGEASTNDAGITLAFTLAAIQELGDPAAVFRQARRWSEHVGIVADDTEAVEQTVAKWGLRQDYEIGTLDTQSVLSRLKWEADTPRFVLIGTDEADAELASYVGWEFLRVEAAAAAADWQLRGEMRTRARVWAWIRRLLPWSV